MQITDPFFITKKKGKEYFVRNEPNMTISPAMFEVFDLETGKKSLMICNKAIDNFVRIATSEDHVKFQSCFQEKIKKVNGYSGQDGIESHISDSLSYSSGGTYTINTSYTTLANPNYRNDYTYEIPNTNLAHQYISINSGTLLATTQAGTIPNNTNAQSDQAIANLSASLDSAMYNGITPSLDTGRNIPDDSFCDSEENEDWI